MKYHAVWKPGGHPRRGMGSRKRGHRQLQAIKSRGTVPGKGAAILEEIPLREKRTVYSELVRYTAH